MDSVSPLILWAIIYKAMSNVIMAMKGRIHLRLDTLFNYVAPLHAVGASLFFDFLLDFVHFDVNEDL